MFFLLLGALANIGDAITTNILQSAGGTEIVPVSILVMKMWGIHGWDVVKGLYSIFLFALFVAVYRYWNRIGLLWKLLLYPVSVWFGVAFACAMVWNLWQIVLTYF